MKTVVFSLIVLSFVASISVTMGANNPTITLTPAQGMVGTPVSISGQGFSVGVIVSFSFDNNIVAAARPDMFGRVFASFLAPSVSNGPHTVTGTDANGAVATATFTIGQNLPSPGSSSSPSSTSGPTTSASISLSKHSGAAGSSVRITGSRFEPSSLVKIGFDGSTLTSTFADAAGLIDTTISIPSVSAGTHSITAYDSGSKYAAATFTVSQGSSPISTDKPVNPNQGVSNVGFWSTPVILGVTALIAVIAAIPLYFFLRRSPKETAPPKEPEPTYKPAPTVATTRTPVSARPTSYAGYKSYSSPSLSRPRPVIASRYNQPVMRNRPPQGNMTICRYCRQPVRNDYNICPHCRKKLR